MRLGQLARRLAISPTTIVEFLEQRNIQLEAGANTKLDDMLALEIIRHFAPDQVDEIFGNPARETDPINNEPAEEPGVMVNEPGPTPSVEVSPLETTSSEGAESESEKADVIKAPKVELQGLKVIGKIDLPEKKKGSAEEEESARAMPDGRQEDNTVDKPRTPVNRTSYQKPDRREQWNREKTRQRQNEELEATRKRKLEEERKKELRTQNYLKKVKSVPSKAARRMDEQVIEMTEEVSEPPKTWLGRFVRWLTT